VNGGYNISTCQIQFDELAFHDLLYDATVCGLLEQFLIGWK